MKLGQKDPNYEVQETYIFREDSKEILLYKLNDFPNKAEIVDLVFQIIILHFYGTMVQNNINFCLELLLITELVEAKNAGRRCGIRRIYFEKYAKSPPESCDFETTLTNLKEEKPQIFETQKFQAEETILERNQFWETHQSFRPEKWETIPLDKKMDSFSHMDFAIEDELHWEDPIVDPNFEPNNRVFVFLLAATGCGKTSTIYRALSKQYGFYFCCDASSKFSQFDDNVITKDYLMDQFYQTMASLSAEQIIAFGGNISHLLYISRLLSLYIDCDGEKIRNEQENNISPTDRTKIPTPSQFLKLQSGSSTKKSKEIFLWLLEKNYHHAPLISHRLEILLQNFFWEFQKIFKCAEFYLFFDEAQLFCPNEHKLLQNKYTCTPAIRACQNDLLFPILDNSAINGNINIYCVIGSTFIGEYDGRVIRDTCKEKPVEVIVGLSLIETKDDLLKKLKSIMNVTKELSEFIDTSIHEYLPLRRGVFTLACSKILKNNQNNMKSFKKAFDESFEDTKKTIIKKLMNKKLTEREEINVKTLLKFFHCLMFLYLIILIWEHYCQKNFKIYLLILVLHLIIQILTKIIFMRPIKSHHA